MTRTVTFDLGPAISLASRALNIYEHMQATGTESMLTRPTATATPAIGATDTSVAVALTANKMYRAELVDTLSSGEASRPAVLYFDTNRTQFPGPAGARLKVYSISDAS